MKVEAEKDELALKNENGVIIIIPRDQRETALNALSRGDYATIDRIAQNLPEVKDYQAKQRADDGLVLSNGNPKTTTKKSNKPKGVFTEDEFTKLQSDYCSGKYVKYGEPKNPNNPEDKWGCLSGSYTNFSRLYPEFPTHYADFADLPNIITKGNNPANTIRIDSWEYPWVIQEYNLGKVLFNYDIHKEKDNPALKAQRLDELRKIKTEDLPLGTVLNTGDALTSGYIDPDAKSFRGKDEPLYRHSIVKMGFVEGKDAEGNPVVDDIYDNLGTLIRVGKSENAIKWDEFVDKFNVGAATTRTSLGDWTYQRLKGDDYQPPLEPFNLASKSLKKMTGLSLSELKTKKGELFDKSIGFEHKTDEQMNQEFVKKVAIKLDKLRKGSTKNLDINKE